MTEPLLEVKNLQIEFDTDDVRLRAVDGISFKVMPGKTLGIVGESGCGKSVTALAAVRLLPKPASHIVGGEVLYRGQDLLKFPVDELHKIRGRRISMIFQEPMTALNPVEPVGKQIAEVYQLHFPEMSKADIKKATVDIMEKVGIPDPEKRLKAYPHQLSGGLRQRIVIAIALACEPDILIADEPTTALDVTIQAQILDLLRTMQAKNGMSIIFITHDLGVVAQLCDDVMVLYAGRVSEQGPVKDIFQNPSHPYTKGLLESIPRLTTEPKSKLKTIQGMVPSLHHMPKGCRFENRCPYAVDKCRVAPPDFSEVSAGRWVRCYEWQKVVAS